MAVDPRILVSRNCLEKNAPDQAKKKNALDALKNVSNIEINSKIQGGLQKLVQLSAIGGLPFGLGDTISSFFDAVGGSDPSKLTEVLSSVNPQLVNQSLLSAKEIIARLTSGSFSPSDIPKYVQDIGNLEKIIKRIYIPPSKVKKLSVCEPSPYAKDLIMFHPKYKFLFVVDFVFNEYFQGLGAGTNKKYAFLIKRSDRPNVVIEHQEINMYNFKTSLPTHIKYEPISMSFYDDQQNSALEFVQSYLKLMSPIANMLPESSSLMPDSGMDFSQINQAVVSEAGAPADRYSASLGAINGIQPSIIKYINIYHLYDYGKFMTAYHLVNPKITNIKLDEVTMTDNGDGSEISIDLVYDSVYIESKVINDPSVGIEEKTQLGNYHFGTTLTEAELQTRQDLAEIERRNQQPDTKGKLKGSAALSEGFAKIKSDVASRFDKFKKFASTNADKNERSGGDAAPFENPSKD